MPPAISRRACLRAIGGAAAAGVISGAAPAAAGADCPETEALESDVEALRAEVAALEDDFEDLSARAWNAHGAAIEAHAAGSERRFPESTRDAAAAVGRAVRESVVLLETEEEFGASTSTGWFVEDGYVLTNAHNVDGDYRWIGGQTVDGDAFDVEVLGFDEDRDPDVALLRTEYDGAPLPTAEGSSPSDGEELVVVGHPGGFGYWVISLGAYLGDGDGSLRLDAPILSGSSGSPVVTLAGEAVGMIHASVSEAAYDGGRPVPHGDDVYTGLLTPDAVSVAVPIGEALDRAEEWR